MVGRAKQRLGTFSRAIQYRDVDDRRHRLHYTRGQPAGVEKPLSFNDTREHTMTVAKNRDTEPP